VRSEGFELPARPGLQLRCAEVEPFPVAPRRRALPAENRHDRRGTAV